MTFYEQPPSKEKIKGLLDFDALDQAEKVTGKSYKEDKATESLGLVFHLLKNEEKKSALQASGDTYYSMKLDGYLRVVKDLGFEQICKTNFHSGSSGKEESYYVFFNAKKGLLLSFDTYGADHVNGGHVYFNWRQKENVFPSGVSGGFSLKDKNVFVGNLDCREALRFNIEELEKDGELLSEWIEKPMLWLLHHQDTKGGYGSYDYDKIASERISALPEYVRKAITPKE